VCVCVCQRHRCRRRPSRHRHRHHHHHRRRRRRRRRCRCSSIDRNCVCRLRASLLRTRVHRVSRISRTSFYVFSPITRPRSSKISENIRRRGENVEHHAPWIDRCAPLIFIGRGRPRFSVETNGCGYYFDFTMCTLPWRSAHAREEDTCHAWKKMPIGARSDRIEVTRDDARWLTREVYERGGSPSSRGTGEIEPRTPERVRRQRWVERV